MSRLRSWIASPSDFMVNAGSMNAWEIEKVRHRSKSDNKVLEFERVRAPIQPVRDHDPLFVDIHLLHVAKRKN